MPVKRSDCVVGLKKAYKIANDFFLENDYAGVYEVRETDSSWLFVPKCKATCYGVADICVPKNGEEPYIFCVTDVNGAIMWENAKVISV